VDSRATMLADSFLQADIPLFTCSMETRVDGNRGCNAGDVTLGDVPAEHPAEIYVFPVAATARAGNPRGRHGGGRGRRADASGKWHPRVRIANIFASIKRIACLEFAARLFAPAVTRRDVEREDEERREGRGRGLQKSLDALPMRGKGR